MEKEWQPPMKCSEKERLIREHTILIAALQSGCGHPNMWSAVKPQITKPCQVDILVLMHHQDELFNSISSLWIDIKGGLNSEAVLKVIYKSTYSTIYTLIYEIATNQYQIKMQNSEVKILVEDTDYTILYRTANQNLISSSGIFLKCSSSETT